MRYSVFTVSIPDLEPEAALREMKALGYEGVEWRVVDQGEALAGKPGFWAGNRCTWPLSRLLEDADRIRRLTQEMGMVMPSVGTYVSCEDLAQVELAMQGVSRLGARQLRVGVGGYDGKAPYLPLRDRALRQYCEVAALAGRYGLRALVEIHMNSLIPSASAAADFVRHFDPAQVGVIHDAGNMVYEGYEQYAMGLALLGPYLAHVHLKNARWETAGDRPDGSVIWRAVSAPLDQGVVDVAALFRALREVGYEGWISTEDFSTEHGTLEKLRRNREFIRRVEAAG